MILRWENILQTTLWNENENEQIALEQWCQT